jgi:hypothetical protein
MQKKNLCFFSVAVSFVLCKTQLWKITTQEECLSGSHMHIGKTVSSDVSGNYLIKVVTGMLKYLFPVIGFQSVDTVNIKVI